MTPTPDPTSTAAPEPTATPTSIPELETLIFPLFGPISGQIDHHNDFAERVFFGPQVPKDVIIDATFYKPEGQLVWDSGILFGLTEERVELLMVTEDGWGYVPVVFGDVRFDTQLVSNRYQEREGGGVKFRLIIKGSEGWVIVNGNFERKFKFGDEFDPGAASVFTGFFTNDVRPGHTSFFEEFTVWEWNEELAAIP